MPSSVPRTRHRCVPRQALIDIIEREYPGEGQIAAMARGVDCDEAAIRNLWYSKYTWVSFDKADRILTGLGLVHAWHTEPALIEVWEWLDSVSQCSVEGCEAERHALGMCEKHYQVSKQAQRTERQRERRKRNAWLRTAAQKA